MLLNLCRAIGTHCYVLVLLFPGYCLPLLPKIQASLPCPVTSLEGAWGQVKGANVALGEATCRSPASPCSARLASPAPDVCVMNSFRQHLNCPSAWGWLMSVFLVGPSSPSPWRLSWPALLLATTKVSPDQSWCLSSRHCLPSASSTTLQAWPGPDPSLALLGQPANTHPPAL